MKVFIVGIDGDIGRRVADGLRYRKHSVAGLVRKEVSAVELRRAGVQITVDDLVTMSVDTLAVALHGSDAVLFTAGAGGKDGPDATTNVDGEGPPKVAAAAQAAGVHRMILVSVFPEAWRERPMNQGFEHYIVEKKKAETRLVAFDLDWVILRPAALSDSPGNGRIDLGVSKIHVSIARDDVATTLVELIAEVRIRRVILELTAGKENISAAVNALIPT